MAPHQHGPSQTHVKEVLKPPAAIHLRIVQCSISIFWYGIIGSDYDVSILEMQRDYVDIGQKLVAAIYTKLKVLKSW